MKFLQTIACLIDAFWLFACRKFAEQRGAIDINNYFATDEAFTLASLTKAINHMEYVPGRIGQMGLFEEVGIATTVVILEEEYGTIRLIPTSPRGGVPEPVSRDPRKARSFVVPHIPVMQQVRADEVQNVKAFGVAGEAQASAAGIPGSRQSRNSGLPPAISTPPWSFTGSARSRAPSSTPTARRSSSTSSPSSASRSRPRPWRSPPPPPMSSAISASRSA